MEPTVKTSGFTSAELDAMDQEARAPAPAGTNPETKKPFTAPEMVTQVRNTLLGPEDKTDYSFGMNPLQLGLAGAGHKLKSLYAGVTGGDEVPSYDLYKNTSARIGSMIPQAVASALVPPSVPAQMALAGGMGAMEPGGPVTRLGNAAGEALGAGAGQAAATGMVKGVNARRGDVTRAGQVQQASKANGLDLSAGQMLDSPTLQAAERASVLSPTRQQAEQVATMMTNPKGDPISLAVNTAYDTANGRVKDAVMSLDSLIAANPKIPKVAPIETVATLRDIFKHNPESIRNIDDAVLRTRVEALATGKAVPNLTFSELDDLRRAVGPVMAKIETQSQSGASNVTTATANRWKQLYGATVQDIDNWGTKSGLTQDAVNLHNHMKEVFKQEVLPLRNHPIAGKILEGKYQRPEDLVRDLISTRNKSIVADLYPQLDQAGKDTFDAIQMAKRGSKEFVSGEPAPGWTKPLTITAATAAGATAPHWIPPMSAALPLAAVLAGGEQAGIHALNSPWGKKWVGGSPAIASGNLPNRLGYVAPREAARMSGLEALHQRAEAGNQ